MVPPGPIEDALHPAKRQLAAMQRTIQRSFDKLRRRGDKIQKSATVTGHRQDAKMGAFVRMEAPGSTHGRTREFRGVSGGDKHFHLRPFELPKFPQVRSASVGGEGSCSEARCQHVSLEGRPRARDGVDTPVPDAKRSISHGVLELSLCQAALEPLAPDQQPVLA